MVAMVSLKEDAVSFSENVIILFLCTYSASCGVVNDVSMISFLFLSGILCSPRLHFDKYTLNLWIDAFYLLVQLGDGVLNLRR